MRKPTDEDMKAIEGRWDRKLSAWRQAGREGMLPLVVVVPDDAASSNSIRLAASSEGWSVNKISETEYLVSERSADA